MTSVTSHETKEEANEYIDPVRIPLGNGTFVTKKRGKLVMVRKASWGDSIVDIGMDLLGEVGQAFRSSSRSPKRKISTTFEFEEPDTAQFYQSSFPQQQQQLDPYTYAYSMNAQHQTAMAGEGQEQLQQEQQQNPGGIGPTPEAIMGPHGYGARVIGGNRQLALMPIPGSRSMNTYPGSQAYSQQMYPGYMPYGADINNTWGLMGPWGPNPRTNFTVTKHICANCGNLRSRKYQSEHPIVAGEVPTPAFCRKCQKDASSTDDESDGSEVTSRKSKKSKRRQDKEKKKDKIRLKVSCSLFHMDYCWS